MTSSDDARLREQAREVASRVGHPGELWRELVERVQGRGIRRFAEVRNDWLTLVWSLDAFRRVGVAPEGMGKTDDSNSQRLEGVYRGKGNYFATLVALLLQNRTTQEIKPRARIRGFSQWHQVDLAWPAREVDPLICTDAKVTGGPAYSGKPSRRAMADFTNRRKELKFTATDLKLWRRQDQTAIDHWGVWRADAPPRTYFLWAARLATDRTRGNDDINKLVAETQALINTYLEGAGLFAWAERNGRYEAVPLPPLRGDVADLDDVLYRIESEIKRMVKAGKPPEPARPATVVVDLRKLASDKDEGK